MTEADCIIDGETSLPTSESTKGADISSDALSANIEALARELEVLNGKTEKEFLSIGANLTQIYTKVGDISTSASSTAELIMGKEISRAIGDFEGLQSRVNDYLNRIKTEMSQCMKNLRNVLKLINCITKPVMNLKEIAHMLQMLAISTRIVTVNLSKRDSSFIALADNIKGMSRLINSKSADIMTQAKSLAYLVNSAISTLRKLEQRQSSLAVDILKNTNLGLDAITNMKNKSSGAAGISSMILGRSNEISSNISEIMVSLQFHDITHQKIAHKIQEMDSTVSSKPSTDGVAEEGSQDEMVYLGRIYDNCKKSFSDLEAVKTELYSAVQGIVVNLRGIALNVAELSSEISKTAGAVSEDYSSFWSEMDQVMSSFTTSIREDADTSGKLSEVMGSVAGTVSNMSLYVSDIEEIGSDIKLIAFNTRIKAAHVGTEGAAVGLLAEKIQKLSIDASVKTSEILDTLNNITRSTEELSNYEQSGVKIEEVGLDDVVSRLVDILNPLHMVDDKIISFLSQMENNSSGIVKKTNDLAVGIIAHKEVDDVLGAVLAEMDEIKGSIFYAYPDIESFISSESHESEAEERPAEDEGGEGDDIGDNIELF